MRLLIADDKTNDFDILFAKSYQLEHVKSTQSKQAGLFRGGG